MKPPLCSSTAHISWHREREREGGEKERALKRRDRHRRDKTSQCIVSITPSNSVGGCVVRVKRAGYERFVFVDDQNCATERKEKEEDKTGAL